MENKTKARPTHRVSFARIIGTDQYGKDQLGPAREIGAMWARPDAAKGWIMRFDHVPMELGQHQGVVFVTMNDDQA